MALNETTDTDINNIYIASLWSATFGKSIQYNNLKRICIVSKNSNGEFEYVNSDGDFVIIKSFGGGCYQVTSESINDGDLVINGPRKYSSSSVEKLVGHSGSITLDERQELEKFMNGEKNTLPIPNKVSNEKQLKKKRYPIFKKRTSA